MDQRPDIAGMTMMELKEMATALGEKPYRGSQIFKWVYRGAQAFEEMTVLPKAFLETLKDSCRFTVLRESAKVPSKDGTTIKYLFLLPDDHIIESVVMEYHHGNALCLSTQVGCRMGCGFCASQTGGFIRNLTAGEMTAQVLAAQRDLLSRGRKGLSNLVLMGSGEPLDNYDNTLKFLRLIHDPEGFNLGYRHITVSTCGLANGIRALAQEGMPVNLAVSLHSVRDEVRRQLIPSAAANPLRDILDAAREYAQETGRRVTFEYALIKGINDSMDDARALASHLKGFPSHVNLIPLNEGPHTPLKRSGEETVRRFLEVLTSLKVQVTRRRELGLDIGGACGQLKASHIKQNMSQ